MRRDKRLYALSWGHHHGLVFASRLSAAIGKVANERLVAYVREFWETELTRHFTVEETTLLPACHGLNNTSLPAFQRMQDEHVLLRSLAARIFAEKDAPPLAEFVDRLRAHIRFEERELFPQIEAALPEEALERVGAVLAEALPARTTPLPFPE